MAAKKTEETQEPVIPVTAPATEKTPEPIKEVPLSEGILTFLGKQKPKEYASLNDFLKISYEKQYNTRDFARELKNTLSTLAAEGKVQVFGLHELDTPYWENTNGNGTPTKYKSAAQVNIQAILIQK